MFWKTNIPNSPDTLRAWQMKALKVLVMYLFVTLLINKIPGIDNRHHLFNILGNENKEELLTGSNYILHFSANWKNYITEANIPECSMKSTFKQVWVILQIYPITVRWHKRKPWTNLPKKKWCAMGTSFFPQL